LNDSQSFTADTRKCKTLSVEKTGLRFKPVHADLAILVMLFLQREVLHLSCRSTQFKFDTSGEMLLYVTEINRRPMDGRGKQLTMGMRAVIATDTRKK